MKVLLYPSMFHQKVSTRAEDKLLDVNFELIVV